MWYLADNKANYPSKQAMTAIRTEKKPSSVILVPIINATRVPTQNNETLIETWTYLV